MNYNSPFLKSENHGETHFKIQIDHDDDTTDREHLTLLSRQFLKLLIFFFRYSNSKHNPEFTATVTVTVSNVVTVVVHMPRLACRNF